MTGGASPPPKNCPVCGGKIWAMEDIPRLGWNEYDVPGRYRRHMTENHPVYAVWRRKMSMGYVVALVAVVFGLSFLGVGLAQYQVWSAQVGQIISLSAFPAAGVVMVIIWTFVQKGTKRFRERWHQEHGMRTGLQQNMEKQELFPD